MHVVHQLISTSNFAYSATENARASTEYIGIKIAVLPHAQQIFTVIMLSVLQRISQVSSYSENGVSPQYFVLSML